MSNLILFICISILLVLIILIATYFINIPTNDYEKHSAYECGFEPFGDARSFFDIHFYTIGLLFIIFDLEIVFLIPAIVDVANISLIGYINFIVFLLVVLIGFYYEWAIGLLNWVPKKIHFINGVVQLSSPFLFILSESNKVMLVFILFITVSLLLNQLNNLVYRVLNLVILSILTVATWAYFTDLTFLYIVYILAFTGAVIMLFLSVVLMLPTSVTTNLQLYNFSLIIITEVHHKTFISQFWNFTIFCTILLLVYFTILFFKTLFDIDKEWPNFIKLQNLSKLNELFGLNAPTDIYGAFTKNSMNMNSIPPLALVGLYWQNYLYYIYFNIESQMYNGFSKHMYKFTSPVWGKLFMVLEYDYAPAKSIHARKFPIPDIRRPYQPAELRWSLSRLLPYVISIILFKYIHGNDPLTKWINRTIFIINFILHFTINIPFNLIIYFYTAGILNIVLIKQLCVVLCLLFIVIPVSFTNFNLMGDIVQVSIYENIDSLLAIKEILYEYNALYLIISVIGLLIALIGSAVFTRGNK